jgi:hypothetical protein
LYQKLIQGGLFGPVSLMVSAFSSIRMAGGACSFSCRLRFATVEMISERNVRSQRIGFSGHTLSC